MTCVRRRWALAVAAATAACVSCSAPGPTDVEAGSVPLEFVPDSNRLVADVEVAGVDLRVLVDTGSVGLRVMADRVPATAVTPIGPASAQSYGSGVALTGTAARAPVRIGPLTSVTPVPVELVTATSCVPGRPRCAAADGRAPETFGGELDGILGIGPLGSPDVPNPLWYFGPAAHTFTIRHDPAGTSALVPAEPPDGFVLHRLTPAPARGRLPDGPPSWEPRIAACVDAAPLPTGRTCGPTLLDTGNPLLALVNEPRAVQGPLPAGTPAGIASATGAWSTRALVGPDDPVIVGRPPTGNAGSVVGLSGFARLDVRFDLDSGTVGLRPRPV